MITVCLSLPPTRASGQQRLGKGYQEYQGQAESIRVIQISKGRCQLCRHKVYYDACRKNAQNVMDAFLTIAKMQPE